MKTAEKLMQLRSLMLSLCAHAQELANDDELVNMEPVSEALDGAYLLLDDVRQVTLEDLGDWAAEDRDERRAE